MNTKFVLAGKVTVFGFRVSYAGDTMGARQLPILLFFFFKDAYKSVDGLTDLARGIQ